MNYLTTQALETRWAKKIPQFCTLHTSSNGNLPTMLVSYKRKLKFREVLMQVEVRFKSRTGFHPTIQSLATLLEHNSSPPEITSKLQGTTHSCTL